MNTHKRASDRSTRAKMRSPGRPKVAHRAQQVLFWRLIEKGVSSEAAAVQVGASAPVGSRWFREAGGMPPSQYSSSAQSLSGRYLCFEEREEIALCRAQGLSVSAIARKLGRAASTVSRELRRNAATRSGSFEYRATTAQWHANRAARRPKATRLTLNETLRQYVEDRLSGHGFRWGCCCRSRGALDKAAFGASSTPQMGLGLEPRANCALPAFGFSG